MKLQRIMTFMAIMAISIALVGCATGKKTVVTDQDIANNIKSHLESPAGPDGPFVIEIIVDKGIVKLDGKVKDPGCKDKAGDIAQQAQGVKEVKNFVLTK